MNSLSGGKTSSYIAAHYPADYNVFALVRTNDRNCMFPDKKIRQIVSDKIGTEFIGTLEMDNIIYTMLDLEQFIGSKIDWVSGETFEDLVDKKGGYLPNIMSRYCTTELKMSPIFNFWRENVNKIVDMRIGFRANEGRRASKMIDRLNDKGVSEFKAIVGKSKKGNRNKWKGISWRVPKFPLIEDGIYKDNIENYWQDKSVRFAMLNNCVGCFHRNPVLLKKMHDTNSNKMEFFNKLEENNKGFFKKDLSYKQIINSFSQIELSFDDFDECDSGYCGL